MTKNKTFDVIARDYTSNNSKSNSHSNSKSKSNSYECRKNGNPFSPKLHYINTPNFEILDIGHIDHIDLNRDDYPEKLNKLRRRKDESNNMDKRKNNFKKRLQYHAQESRKNDHEQREYLNRRLFNDYSNSKPNSKPNGLKQKKRKGKPRPHSTAAAPYNNIININKAQINHRYYIIDYDSNEENCDYDESVELHLSRLPSFRSTIMI